MGVTIFLLDVGCDFFFHLFFRLPIYHMPKAATKNLHIANKKSMCT